MRGRAAGSGEYRSGSREEDEDAPFELAGTCICIACTLLMGNEDTRLYHAGVHLIFHLSSSRMIHFCQLRWVLPSPVAGSASSSMESPRSTGFSYLCGPQSLPRTQSFDE